MRLNVLAAASALALSLAACSQGEEAVKVPAEPPAPPAALAGVDLNQPLSLVGTEPFWGIRLTGEELIYSGVDRPEQRAPRPALTVQGTVATLQTRSATGVTFDVTLTATECSDGMSDRTYPLTALVKVGEETLMGCAASTAALNNAGESGPVTEPAAQPAA
jgi:uncharacterized membrane protein